MPPSAHGVKVISIGMFTKGNTPVVWRGPMLHRALQQFLADVYWGDLDVLLLDLPPGHRRHRHLGGAAGADRRDAGRHHPAAGRRGGRRTGRRDRVADPPADRRRHREHVVAALPALRRAARRVRLRRRRDGGGSALTRIDRHPGAAARTGPDRRAAARGRRRRRCRWCSATPTPRPRSALRKIADELGARRRGLAGRLLGLTAALGPGPVRSRRSRTADARRGRARGAARTGPADAVAAARAPSPLRSSKRCLCTNRFGFRSSMSKSANSGPSPSRRSFFAPSAIRRRSRRARPAWEAIFGSSCGPKMTSAITARTSSLGRDRSNTVSSPSGGQLRTSTVNRRRSTMHLSGTG